MAVSWKFDNGLTEQILFNPSYTMQLQQHGFQKYNISIQLEPAPNTLFQIEVLWQW